MIDQLQRFLDFMKIASKKTNGCRSIERIIDLLDRCVLPSMDYKGNTENENLLRQAVASTRKGRNLLLRLAAVFVIFLVVILHGVYRNDGGRQEEPYEPLKSSSVLEELSTTPSTLLSADKDKYLNDTDSIEEIFQFTNLTDTQIAAAEDGYRGQRELMMNGTGYDDIDAVQAMNSDPLPARLFHGKDAHEMCRSREGGCIAPFARIRPLIVTAPNHKIMSCVVQKSMSSVMLATMCYLLRGEEFIKAGRSLLFDLGAFGFCQNKNNFPNVDSMLETLRTTNPHDIRFTMITRDPVDRFLSGFVDRCIR
ncbi:unnamed protein product [Nippostrongylus brasiliensis]|uniref:CRAL-TRIO domain-containing protein n=1 Tax=Nippostrongylus brasiliensis TaxID=27835 RepID=A0A0N4YRP8_NIPBR|nr:unnamed protein product [Nippostrongylus brasiliensis]